MKNYNNRQPKFSFFKGPVTNTRPFKNITLFDAYRGIKTGYLKEETEQLRLITDKAENRKFKATHFPYVTFSGIFSQRNEHSLIKHSRLIALDFDHLKDLAGLKKKLLKDRYFETELLFTSPNGNGLKWIISIDISEQYPQATMFQAIYNYIKKTYSVEIDKACKDVSRATFLCFDNEVYLNPKYSKEKDFIEMKRYPFNPDKWLVDPDTENRTPRRPIPRTETGIHHDVEIVIRRIENAKLDLTCNYEDWIQLGFAFADEFGEFGRHYFHKVSRYYLGYNPAGTDRQYDKCLKGRKSGVSIRSFFQAAKDAGINIRV